MTLKYATLGFENESIFPIISRNSKLLDYRLVGSVENKDQLLDTILSETPRLIYINIDNYKSKDFSELADITNDLYRSFIHKPYLVAIASSKKHAFACIKNNYFYYLLRPIDELQLHKLDFKLHKVLLTDSKAPAKLCLKTYGDYRFIEINDILYLKADNNSTEFFLNDQTKVVAFKTLKHFESILPKTFRRIHQSFVINEKYVSRIHLGKSECYLKKLKMKLPFSKSYKKVMTDMAITLSSNTLS